MKPAKVLFLLVCLLGLAASSLAQNAEILAKLPRSSGYLDPKTGIFHNVPKRTPLSPQALIATTKITGKFVLDVTIALDPNLPATVSINCSAFAGVIDAAGDFSNGVSIAATRSSPTTAICTLTMPYSWDLATPSTDNVTLDLSVSANAGPSFTSPGFYDEFFSAPAMTIKVPPNGTTTTKPITTTI